MIVATQSDIGLWTKQLTHLGWLLLHPCGNLLKENVSHHWHATLVIPPLLSQTCYQPSVHLSRPCALLWSPGPKQFILGKNKSFLLQRYVLITSFANCNSHSGTSINQMLPPQETRLNLKRSVPMQKYALFWTITKNILVIINYADEWGSILVFATIIWFFLVGNTRQEKRMRLFRKWRIWRKRPKPWKNAWYKKHKRLNIFKGGATVGSPKLDENELILMKTSQKPKCQFNNGDCFLFF